jgi:hypothetical protein
MRGAPLCQGPLSLRTFWITARTAWAVPSHSLASPNSLPDRSRRCRSTSMRRWIRDMPWRAPDADSE